MGLVHRYQHGISYLYDEATSSDDRHLFFVGGGSLEGHRWTKDTPFRGTSEADEIWGPMRTPGIVDQMFIRCLGGNDVVFGEGLDPQVASLGGWRKTLTQTQSVVLSHKAKNYRAHIDWQDEIRKRLNRYILPIISGILL